MKRKTQMVTIYGITHFIVDFLCAIFMTKNIQEICFSYNEYFQAIIIYNFFAFAFQVPLGIIFDKFRIYKFISIIGICLIALAYWSIVYNPIILAMIIGLGNALFHLEGGINVYKKSNKKAALNGIFVAPGALGIFFGTTMNDTLSNSFLILLIISTILILFLQNLKNDKEDYDIIKEDIYNNKIKIKYIIVLLVGISIIVRSIVGNVLIYTWKTKFYYSFLYVLGIFIGKFIGGVIGDKIGFNKTTTISLITSIPFFFLGFKIPIFGILGICLFNIPMAITLTLLANTLKERTGLAIGLNTFFLFIGFLLSFIDISINNNIIITLSIFLAVITIALSLKIFKSKEVKIQ